MFSISAFAIVAPMVWLLTGCSPVHSEQGLRMSGKNTVDFSLLTLKDLIQRKTVPCSAWVSELLRAIFTQARHVV